jgi:glycosyltransferase involved in cell wall biosynthesis
MKEMRATIVISTRNRVDELRTALASVVSQSVACEVIVLDDASNDGTAEMVRVEFPHVRLERVVTAQGYIKQRNLGARLATGDVIFSLDDDAAFATPVVVAQTLAGFDDERVGAVAIPYTDVNKDNVVRQRAPDDRAVWTTDRFIGTAHAVRRDVFLEVGGYREFFVHQGEEGDFCLRMLNMGRVVRLGNSDLIHHFESPKRDMSRMDFYGRRNDILFTTLNVPMPWLAPHLIMTMFNGWCWAYRIRRFRHMCRGMLIGLVDSVRCRQSRAPVPGSVYRLHRRLKKDGPLRLAEIESMLPPVPACGETATSLS